MTHRRRFVQSAASLVALGAFPLAARAQAFESVRIINGFPAGGTADSTSRRVAERLGGTAYSKNAAVVENKPGAGGRIACETVKAAAPDGSTLLLTPYSCTAIYPHIYRSLSYDPFRDFVPVSMAAVMTHALTVGPQVPASVKTVRDFLAWAKANPDKANYGSPAAGSTPHFLAALLGINTGVELKHVPYRGSLPAVADMIGGTLASTSTPTGDALANHKAGKIRIIATSGAQRTPFTPEVATYAEQGFPDLTTEEWFGFYAPARTPAGVVANANAAINAALRDKGVIDSLALMGLVAQGSSAAEMDKSQRDEHTRWAPLVKRIGFTAES
ncbi:Bug family tripartite tricarboxylate transporter substrate binding protein [Ramlibacter tataouinensis]|uniref:Candidate extracytoplasmic binding receptor n=1 Tax=Ramlibacter tataouinensis (strain ATCC BAA-407 / DSM 14655 / LMG 21543 / TTB310) TaxID=365046 RepID=F5Y2Q4_RAMTT|nr:Bug family tripartite tricarboxylate transporter substrate binding protein [Ramlibacter tataouinensis]AEG93600.1 Candidate extracytoplasmic binding receptor [Ramlibacter tataouinensis TTB310]